MKKLNYINSPYENINFHFGYELIIKYKMNLKIYQNIIDYFTLIELTIMKEGINSIFIKNEN